MTHPIKSLTRKAAAPIHIHVHALKPVVVVVILIVVVVIIVVVVEIIENVHYSVDGDEKEGQEGERVETGLGWTASRSS